ncbi:MAG: transcription termination/antitermination protein NusG [Anaerolineales bacterium]|nr:transcription termination/antitermination protein NusG [Anaerolineales bacterium]
MDIHENEEQLEELEPISGDPQPVPEPDQDNPDPEVLDTETVEDNTLDSSDMEEENDGEQEESQEDESAPVEFLENLPAYEPEEETLVEEVPVEEVPVEETPVEEVPEEETPVEETLAGEVLTELEEVEHTPVVEVIAEEENFGINDFESDSDEKGKDKPLVVDPYASASLSAEPVKDDGRVWYVIHCYSGNEDKVRHNILQRIESMGMDNLIYDVVVPTEDEVNIKNGERQTVEKKVFPGYILVNMILTEESWYMVRNTPGVTGFVGMGNDPTALQPEEVARILKRMESESPRINVTFRTGERVRIVDGPFEDFYGRVAEIDMDRATVRVMVNFFGRETPVELDFLQVEEA